MLGILHSTTDQNCDVLDATVKIGCATLENFVTIIKVSSTGLIKSEQIKF